MASVHKRPIMKGTPKITSSSASLLEQLANSQHAPGIRRAGCPCCDPESASNYADQMMGR